jgi:peptidyl-prolyl cis-trans isomerase A (cyclophilin A)
MQSSQPFGNRRARRSRTVRAALHTLCERLESRTFLNATLTSAISPVAAPPSSAATTIDLNAHFTDPTVTGTAVVLHSTQGDIPLSLDDAQTPNTVANFLSYTNSGAYNDTVLQRAIPGFILQGGQYLPDQSTIPAQAPIASEAGISNTTGTIAMALSTGPNSATNAWFINLANNTFLDDASDGGPFTAFGNVIYNGMQVVNQIVNLPKGQVAPNFVPFQGDPTGGTLPLQNYAGGTITPANYVTLPSVQVVSPLVYTVTSDNAGLVMPSISNSTLSLNYAAGQTGVANITVTATDLGGNAASTTFAVGVGVSAPLPPPTPQVQATAGAGGAKQVRFIDPDGTSSTLSLTGPGSATLSLFGSGLNESTIKGIATVTGTPTSITISTTGTSAATTVNLTGKGGNGQVLIGGFTADGSIRAINSPQGNLSGAMSLVGSLGTLTLAAASDGSSISAASIGKVTVKGGLDANINSGTLGPVTAGSISPGTWTVTGSAGNITAGSINGLNLSAASLTTLTSRGAISASSINSAGNITSVTAASLAASNIFAGVISNSLPTSSSDLNTTSVIKTVTIRGGYTNSDIAGASLGQINLHSIASTNGGVPFGLASHDITSLTSSVDGKKLNLKRVTSEATVTTALAAAGIAANDFVITIV